MAEDLFESIRARNKAMEAELAQFTERLEALRVRFDRYFMGIDRIPPLKDRTDLERDFRNSKLVKSPKTEIKFRFKGVRSRLTSEARRWDRIMRLIEEGKFKREKGALNSVGVRPATERKKARGSDDPDRQIYDSWREAQSQVGKSANVDFAKFRDKLKMQRDKHKAKYGWSDVNYSVKVKNGRVALVAKPKSSGDEDGG